MTMQTSEGGVIVHDARRDVAPAKATDLLSVIAQAAADPRCDVDKMRALFDMRNEQLDRNAKAAFAKAMSQAQAKMTTVRKAGWNPQSKSSYSFLEDIVKMITPIYTSVGLSLSFGTRAGAPEGCIRVSCDVRHEAGHAESYELDMELDRAGIAGATNKTGPHARGSSISYTRRYLTCMIFHIPTGDDDDGNAAAVPEPDPQMLPITEAEQIEILERLEAIGVEPEVFCKVCKVSSVSEIPKGKLPGVLKRLAQREEASK